jgi:hypothetical protein
VYECRLNYGKVCKTLFSVLLSLNNLNVAIAGSERMSTEAIQPNLRTAVRTVGPVNRTAERVFFGSMAILLCAVVIIGFTPTYFGAGLMRAPLPNTLLHVHGAAFSLWMVLYLVQTALISAKKVAWHRTFGTIAFCLPPIMIVLGTVAGIDALARGVQIGPLDPATSAAIPLIGITAFTVLIYASWRARRRPDAHKRLILLATAGLTEAAFGRFPWYKIGMPPAAGAVTGIGIFVVLMVAYDLFSLRRVHRSTMWAGPVIFLVSALSVPIGMTPPWHMFMGFVLHHVVFWA